MLIWRDIINIIIMWICFNGVFLHSIQHYFSYITVISHHFTGHLQGHRCIRSNAMSATPRSRKEDIDTTCKVFCMTQPGIKLGSSATKTDALTITSLRGMLIFEYLATRAPNVTKYARPVFLRQSIVIIGCTSAKLWERTL